MLHRPPPHPRARRLARLTVAIVVALTALVPAAAGAAVPACRGVPATIVGTHGPDVIHGTNGRDVIVGLSGDDIIRGHDGDDLICGNWGNDRLYGGNGKDRLYGDPGDDALRGKAQDDYLSGGWGNDWLYGGWGTDVGKAGPGSDVCKTNTEVNCEMDVRWGHEPEEWRPLVEEHFGALADEAMGVMACESNGEPFAVNPRSGASGLFQFMPSTWDRWNPRTPGFEGETPFHPEANIATAKRLVDASIEEGHDAWWQWSARCSP